MTDDDVAALEQRLFDRLATRIDERIAPIRKAVDQALVELESIDHGLDTDEDDDTDEQGD